MGKWVGGWVNGWVSEWVIGDNGKFTDSISHSLHFVAKEDILKELL